MEIAEQAEDIAKLIGFLKGKQPEEQMRDAVVRYYMELGQAVGVTATKDVGVIVNEADIGTVDCALANPASIAVAYAEDRLGAMLGLWTVAEFSPKSAIIVLNPATVTLFEEIAAIIRKSSLIGHSPVRFVLLDVKGGRREIVQRRGFDTQRRKIIKGHRQPHKKQD
jgi:hypothetical protein